jgi:hypothetical protein
MSFELKDMSGSIWVNDRKQADSHPDRTGTVKVGGREYFINGWLKETSQGKKYMSLAFKLKEAKQEQAPPPTDDDLNDSIPF